MSSIGLSDTKGHSLDEIFFELEHKTTVGSIHASKIYDNNLEPLDLLRQKNFEELQQLFVNMFEPDINSRVCNKPAKGNHDLVRGQTPPSPPPSLATKAEEPSCKGIDKRGSSAMGTGKPPRFGDAGASHSQPEFCSRVSLYCWFIFIR
jgi:hypothetical protein